MHLLKYFKKAKCKFLHLGWSDSKHKCRLGREQIVSNPEDKDLWLLVDEKLNVRQQCALAAQRAKYILLQSEEAWPTGWGGWFSPSVPLMRPILTVLFSVLRPLAQEGHGAVEIQRRDQEDGKIDRAPLL